LYWNVLKRPPTTLDQAAIGDAADMVARAGQRLADLPPVRRRVVDLVPADARPLLRGVGGAADQVQLAGEHDRGGRAARARQGRDLAPAVLRDLVGEGLVVAAPVLLDEAAQRVDTPGIGRHRDMVGAARQRRRVEPGIRRRVVDGVVGAVDLALAVAADDMHPPVPRGRPCHLAARDGHVGARDPAAWRAGGGRARRDALGALVRRQVVRRAALEEVVEGMRRGRRGAQRRPMPRMLRGGGEGRGGQRGPRAQEQAASHCDLPKGKPRRR